MDPKTLGQTDLKTPPIMFGGNVFGWTLDEKESFQMLDRLLERGLTFIDTADVYLVEYGLSEKIIGKWMKDRGVRDKITLATKGGRTHKKKSDGSVEKGRNNTKKYLRNCIAGSLKRLQTDHIDLYYTHYDDETLPVGEALEAYDKAIQEGKIRYIGASNFSKDRLGEAAKISQNDSLPKYEVFQTEYNLVEREEFETGLREVCEKYDISVATYFSLAAGFLTGKYRKEGDFKGAARKGMTEKYFNDRGQNIVKTLDEVAQDHNISNAGVALAWILQRPTIAAAIASATKPGHIDSFFEALEMSLSYNDVQRLNAVSQC